MGRRIYRVKFEAFEQGGWVQNADSRDVCVTGGAEQAIKEAVKRQKRSDAQGRYRVEQVVLVASED